MKYYVVSDVHGFYTEMIKALTEKGFFKDEEPHKLIVCGDMMDRGSEAVKMQKFMLDLLDKNELIFVRGNHEELMLDLINELAQYKTSDWFFYNNHHHWSNGTMDTTAQLCGVEDEFEVLDHPQDLANQLKQTPFYKKLIPASVNYYETEHYVFVHGWIPFKRSLDSNLNDVYTKHPNWRRASKEAWFNARWQNGMNAAHNGIIIRGKTIVCGHVKTSWGHCLIHGEGSLKGENSIVTPYYNKGIIAIDAQTATSGIVNCIVIED